MPETLARDRLQRVRAALDGAPYDWLLLGLPQNIAYASDYRSVAGELSGKATLAALVSADDLWLVGPCADAAPAFDSGLPEDRFVPFGRFYFESVDGSHRASRLADSDPDFPSALREALVRAGTPRRLGVDDGLTALDRAAVADALPRDALSDAAAFMLSVRSRKLPGEVELLRRAAHLAEDGIAAALAAGGPGSTERDLAAIVAATMAAGGGVPRFVVVTAGTRSALADARPTDHAWKHGELLRFDVGCVVDGYWSDIGRTAVLGAPDRLQAERYRAILAGETAQLEHIGPGVTASELFDRAVATVEQQGLQPYRRHHCGHGIGSEVYEPPIVAPGWDDRLQEGMTFCLETPFYELGWGGMMVEDTVVVTADGAERLNRSDRDLIVVAA